MKQLMEDWNDFLNEEEPVENDKLKLFKEALNEELVTAGHEALTEEYIDYALHEIFGIGSSKKDKSKNWFDTPGDEEAFKGFFKGFTTNNQRLRDAIKDLEALDDNERDKVIDQMKDADTPEEKEDLLDKLSGPIPILKYPLDKDPDTGKRTPPLQACLAAPEKCPDIKVPDADIPQNVINTIIRSVVKQLKDNNVEITEGVKKEIVRLIAEQAVTKGAAFNYTSKKGKDYVVKAVGKSAKAGEVVVAPINPNTCDLTDPSGGRKFSTKKSNLGVPSEKCSEPAALMPAPPVVAYGKGKVPDVAPHSWRTQGGTQEEWEDWATEADKSLFLKMPKNKQHKFFKMTPEQKLALYKKMQARDPSKSDIGAGETSASQADAEKAALARGLDSEEGAIKISTLRAQLATIDPQPDEQTRKAAIGIVHQFLAPYLKKRGIRFSEQQEYKLASNILNIITERNNVKR